MAEIFFIHKQQVPSFVLQEMHDTKCPHGINAILRLLTKHTLQTRSSAVASVSSMQLPFLHFPYSTVVVIVLYDGNADGGGGG